MTLSGGQCRFLDFRAPRNGRLVRELQTADVGSCLSEQCIRMLDQAWESPHVYGHSRSRIIPILDARTPGADARPDMAREVLSRHSPRRYRAFIGRSLSGRGNAASDT